MSLEVKSHSFSLPGIGAVAMKMALDLITVMDLYLGLLLPLGL